MGSFIHVADAADATVGAIEQGSRGVYNVADDDPAPVAEWLPALVQAWGTKKPMRLPRFVRRLFAGEVDVVMMTELRGASTGRPTAGWRGARHTRVGDGGSRRQPEPRRCRRGHTDR